MLKSTMKEVMKIGFLGFSSAQGEPGSVILSSSYQTVGNGIY